ncbi:MAG: PAC2 family protein [Solirubrobacteraceae bacterium]
MQPLIWDHRPSGLRDPAMVCAFQGWNDAGDAASGATSYLTTELDAKRFASVDIEEFYDFQANRPRIALSGEHGRKISWPAIEVFEARSPTGSRDLVLVQGVEPSLRWKTFSSLIVDLADALGVQLVITLGALLADVPHSRPVSMTGSASDPAIMDRLGLHTSSYEGMTGIIGVLHAACTEAGLRTASIWASVPHYVAAAANPKATLALLRKVEMIAGPSVELSELELAAAEYERQVGLAVQSDPDIQAFVERLERDSDTENEDLGPEDLPSGESLAREFQRFLRQRGDDR